MNNRTYLIPGLIGWSFNTSKEGYELLSGIKGVGVAMTADMSATQIAAHVRQVLWMRYRMSDAQAEGTAKAALIVDWQQMIKEAGTDVEHQSPNLPGWTLKISDYASGLWYTGGSGLGLTVDTSKQEISEGIRRVLQYSSTPEQIDATVEEVTRIDFAALISKAWQPRVTPLLEGFTADNSALLESICADVRLLEILQNSNNKALADEVCTLAGKLVA